MLWGPDDGLTPLLHACWAAASGCASELLLLTEAADATNATDATARPGGGRVRADPDTPDGGGEGGQCETPAMAGRCSLNTLG